MRKKMKEKEIVVIGFMVLSILLSTGSDVMGDFGFGTPENLGPAINTPMYEWGYAFPRNGLSLVFLRFPPNWNGIPEGWVAQRETRDDPWDNPVTLGPWINTGELPKVLFETIGGVPVGWGTTDDSEAYFSNSELSGYGSADLFVLKRDTVDADWGPLLNLGPTVNLSTNDYAPLMSPDGLALYFASTNRPGGHGRSDLWVTTRTTQSNPWGVPTNLGPTVNSPSWDHWPSMSPDGLLLFFGSGRPGGLDGSDIWMTRRASLSDPWEQAANLGSPVNTPGDDDMASISPDGYTLYFCTTRPGGYGGYDLWQAPIIPTVDFNSDGIIDLVDMVMLIDNWDTSDTLFDIGPMPWGDGVVDIEDLKVFVEHWEN
jgi:hypothetical protein